MKIFIADTYGELSRQAAQDVSEMLPSDKNPLLCVASGDTPKGVYRELVSLWQQKDLAAYNFVGLDEWSGMNGDTEGSCRYYINQQLFGPLNIKEEQICFFDGKAENLEEECKRTEQFIQTHGGIDVAVLGLGVNGHIGMNEPNTSPNLRSHVAEINAETQQIGQKYFKTEQSISEGLTLGLATIMEAKQLILLVSGKHKAATVKKVVEGALTESLPASLLRQHANLNIYLDAAAASLLSSHQL